MQILYSKSLRSLAEKPSGNWLYLGQDPQVEEICLTLLGADRRLVTGKALEETARSLRLPFRDWIASLASLQKSTPNFWMTTFSGRSPESSGLFQKLCWLELVTRFQAQARACVIDDPWLFQQVIETLPNHGTIGLESAQRDQILQTISLVLRGLASKPMLFLRGAGRIIRSRLHFPVMRFHPKSVALVSYAFPNAVELGENYSDPFFGPLPEVLRAKGYEPYFFFPLHTPSSLFAKISKFGAVVARYAKFMDLVRACVSRAHVINVLPFQGKKIQKLLDQELLLENSSNRYALGIWQKMTWRRVSSTLQGKVIHIFENHPWEKALCFGLKGSRARKLGYQHSTLPDLLMNYLPGNKAEQEFHPDEVVANTPYHRDVLRGWGWENVSCGGSLRPFEVSRAEQKSNAATRKIIFIVMPGVPALAQAFASTLLRAHWAAGSDRRELWIRFHPSVDLSRLFMNAPGIRITNEKLGDVADRIEAVLYVSSTMGLEAILLGLPVLRYVPPHLLTLNPVPSSLENRQSSVDDQGLVELFKGSLKLPASQPAPLDSLVYPVQPEAWLRALESGTA